MYYRLPNRAIPEAPVPALQRVGIESQTDQLLAETVVEVLAKARLLAVADLQDLAL